MDKPQPDLIRPSVAAKRLGVCTETIRRWMRKGHLRYQRNGPYRLQMLKVSDVEALREVVERST